VIILLFMVYLLIPMEATWHLFIIIHEPVHHVVFECFYGRITSLNCISCG